MSFDSQLSVFQFQLNFPDSLLIDSRSRVMDSTNYKEYHEARMVNNTGSPVYEIEAVLTSVSIGVFLRLFLHLHLINISPHFCFWVDFLLVALPVTLEVTVFSELALMLPLTMFLISIGIVCMNTNPFSIKKTVSTQISSQKSYLTNYRASTNLVSILCILAVDFSVFPRKFAKTESMGFGLMDLGVGYFICSNGIVTKNFITRSDFPKIIKSSMILILLGFMRLLSVKSANYHEHASEYGVHWNFFFTLGFCKIVSFFVLTISPIKRPFLLAVFTGLIHQSLLHFGLQQWVFSDADRNTLLSANREGLTSLLGYVSLYFASVAVGQVINKQQNKITFGEVLVKLSGINITAWIFTFFCHSTIGVSRRLANVGYTSWIISSTITVLIEFTLIDIVISSINQGRKKFLIMSQTPILLHSINANALFFFLFANLMTGVINICFQTLLLDTPSSLVLIIIYMVIVCGVSFLLHCNNLILKFW